MDKNERFNRNGEDGIIFEDKKHIAKFFISFKERYQDELIYIKGHNKPDMDSHMSCYLMKRMLDELGYTNVKILVDCEEYTDKDLIKKYGYKDEFDEAIVYNNSIERGYAILVDHSDKKYDRLKTIYCVDHHYHKDDVYPENIVFNIKSSSTAVMIGVELLKISKNISEKDIKAMVIASCMDTNGLKSERALPDQVEYLKNKAKEYNIDTVEIMKDSFEIVEHDELMSNLATYTVNGYKTYEFNKNPFLKFADEIPVQSSYIFVEPESLSNNDIRTIAEYILKNNRLSMWLFIIVEISADESKKDKEKTTCLYIEGETKMYTQYTYKGVVSRGQTIMPQYERYSEGLGSDKIIEDIIKKLKFFSQYVSTMESCTAGAIESTITNYKHSSEVTKGGLISYSNDAKVWFGVPKKTIDDFGVYSEETAIAMAKCASNTFEADYGISSTGSLGRADPANKDSVVGEVHTCIYDNNTKEAHTMKIVFLNNLPRKTQKKFIASHVLYHLYIVLDKII